MFSGRHGRLSKQACKNRDSAAKAGTLDQTNGNGIIGDSDFRSKLAAIEVELEALRVTNQRVLFEAGGRFAMTSATALSSLSDDIAAAWQAQLPQEWFEGQGYRLGQIHVVDAQVPFHRLKSIHPGYDRRAGEEFIARQPEE